MGGATGDDGGLSGAEGEDKKRQRGVLWGGGGQHYVRERWFLGNWVIAEPALGSPCTSTWLRDTLRLKFGNWRLVGVL